MRSRSTITVLLLSACGRVGFAELSCPPLTDAFDDPALPSFWMEWGDGAAAIERRSGELWITPPDSLAGTHFAGYTTSVPVDLEGHQVALAVSEAARADGAETWLEIEDERWIASIGAGRDEMIFRMWDVAKTLPMDDTFLPYSDVAHAWWQLRLVAGDVIWETSPDRTSWSERRRATSPLDASRAYVTVTAGTYKAVSSPGRARMNELATSVPALCAE